MYYAVSSTMVVSLETGKQRSWPDTAMTIVVKVKMDRHLSVLKLRV